MPFIIILSFLSLDVLAISWMELKETNDYQINQAFELTQVERSSSKLSISKGEPVRLKEILNLSNIRVMLFIFNYQNCPGSVMSTQMEIIPVQETTPMVEIGVQLEENCEFHFYLEAKDLMSKSVFE